MGAACSVRMGTWWTWLTQWSRHWPAFAGGALAETWGAHSGLSDDARHDAGKPALASRPAGAAAAGSGAGRDPGRGRGLRGLPHRPARGGWRSAEPEAAV